MSEIKIKRGKTKRRKSKYRKRPLRVIVIILICVLLLVAGFFGAQFLDRWIKYQQNGGEPSSSSAESELPSSSEAPSLPESSALPEPEPEPAAPRMLYVPASSLTGAALDTLCTQVKNAGADTVIVNVKTDDGKLHYPSALADAQQVGAVDAGAVDLRPGIRRLQQSGVKVFAQMACFRDPTAAMRLSGAAVMYAPSPSLYWLDAVNGKPWLDPYSGKAVEYLTGIAGELSGMGFDGVCLNRVQFPDNNSSAAKFRTDTRTREKALYDFIAAVRTAVGGKPVMLRCEAAAAAGAETPIYGSANPLNLGADSVVVDLRLSLLGNRLTIGDAMLNAPANSPTQATEMLVQAVRATTEDCVYLLGADDVSAAALSQQREVLSRLVPDAGVMLVQNAGAYTEDQLAALKE